MLLITHVFAQMRYGLYLLPPVVVDTAVAAADTAVVVADTAVAAVVAEAPAAVAAGAAAAVGRPLFVEASHVAAAAAAD